MGLFFFSFFPVTEKDEVRWLERKWIQQEPIIPSELSVPERQMLQVSSVGPRLQRGHKATYARTVGK